MSKLIWTPGVPKTVGLFWFDAGYRFPIVKEKTPLVAQARMQTNGELNIYVFGDGGSMPLSSVYNPNYCKNGRHAPISEAKNWTKLTSPSDYGRNTRCWLKSPEGYIGVGLMIQGPHGISGQIVWLNHPVNASEGGIHIHPSENYEFSPLVNPVIILEDYI